MPYVNLQALVNDLASYYDDTDASTYTLPPSKLRRYTHYIQRTLDEIYHYKPWPWKMAYKAITFTNHEAQTPPNFANIGPNGALIDMTGEPWSEITFQDMVVMIASGKNLTQHYYTVGNRIADASVAVGDGGVSGERRNILIPSPNDPRSFTLYYETSPPKIDALDLTQLVPLPESFHMAVLLGAVAKLKEGQADPRPIWRSEYIAALAKQVALLMPLNSRTMQMPMTTGRRQW